MPLSLWVIETVQKEAQAYGPLGLNAGLDPLDPIICKTAWETIVKMVGGRGGRGKEEERRMKQAHHRVIQSN